MGRNQHFDAENKVHRSGCRPLQSTPLVGNANPPQSAEIFSAITPQTPQTKPKDKAFDRRRYSVSSRLAFFHFNFWDTKSVL
jgi:hypothetical protein